MNNILSILTVFGLAGVIGAWFNHQFQESSNSKLRIRELKEIQYKNLLNNLMGFFEGWETYNVENSQNRKKQFMWEVYTSAPVYASDEVIKLCYEFIKSHSIVTVSESKSNSDQVYAKLVLAIRKELNEIYGQPDTQLTEKDVRIFKVDSET